MNFRVHLKPHAKRGSLSTKGAAKLSKVWPNGGPKILRTNRLLVIVPGATRPWYFMQQRPENSNPSDSSPECSHFTLFSSGVPRQESQPRNLHCSAFILPPDRFTCFQDSNVRNVVRIQVTDAAVYVCTCTETTPTSLVVSEKLPRQAPSQHSYQITEAHSVRKDRYLDPFLSCSTCIR